MKYKSLDCLYPADRHYEYVYTAEDFKDQEAFNAYLQAKQEIELKDRKVMDREPAHPK